MIEREVMLKFFARSGAAALALIGAPALAQESSQPLPAPQSKPNVVAEPGAASPITINGTATLVSDYRFRGISQTDKNFAVQGSLTVSHSSGVYASVWGSSVDGYVTAANDFYPGGGGTTCCTAHQEIDFIAGFTKTYNGVKLDGGVLYYFYPKTKARGDNTSSDFFEPYADISYTYGPVTAKATINYAFKQKALKLDQGQSQGQIGGTRYRDNVYIAGDLSASVPNTPVGLTAHVGHSFGPSWLATDFYGGKGYTDWGLGASLTYKQITLGVQYVDTNATFISSSGKNASKGGVVGSLGVAF